MKRIKLWMAVAGSMLLFTACGANGTQGGNSEMKAADHNTDIASSGISDTEADQKEKQREQDQGTYQKITPQEAKEMIDNNEVTILDVRTQEEYDEGHIPDAVLIPNETISDEDLDLLPDKAAVILVYCRSGRRSAEAAQKLVQLGYQNIYDFGGIIDWPYDIE